MMVVFKTHFDIGFTDLAENVMETYRNEFIPRAVSLAESLPDQFIWTTGSWLIQHYLTSPDVSEQAKKALEDQLYSGNIRWHGLPATLHSEVGDKTLFEYGLGISKDLDKKYNKVTVASKMTDIPGHTLGIVPILAQAGIKYLHLGVNASSAMPDVPEIFVWRAPTGEEVIIHYAKDYGATFERPDWEMMLTFAHTHDNQGPPHNEQEILDFYTDLQAQYPDVVLEPSGLDAFANYAWSMKDTLPVVEEEIGDTWIHGVASDSYLIAQLKVLFNCRDAWVQEGTLVEDSDTYRNFSEQLMLVVEHTWGTNGNVFLPDYRNYLLKDFQKAREAGKITLEMSREKMDFADLMAQISTDPTDSSLIDKRHYALHEASWEEQRQYIQKGLKALPDSLQKRAIEALEAMKPSFVNGQGGLPIQVGEPQQIGDVTLTFDRNGGICSLRIHDKEFMEEGKYYGALSYERFDFGNYQEFLSKYSRLNQRTAMWALVDFNKRGIEAYQEIRYEHIRPYVTHLHRLETSKGARFCVTLAFKQQDQVQWGLPKRIETVFDVDASNHTIETTLKWAEKQANRMPEAYWFETSISVNNPHRWMMSKLGSSLSPDAVVRKGNRNIHALDQTGMTYRGSEATVNLQSIHAPLYSMGRKGLLKFDQKQCNLNDGIYVLLQNNTWGTNFRDWFEEDMQFKFTVNIKNIV